MVAVTMHHFSGLAAPFVRSKGTVSGGVFINEAGQSFKYEGSLVSHGDNDLLGIASAELRKILSMPELAAFDGMSSEG